MSVNDLILVASTIIVPLIIFSAWLSKSMEKISSSQEINKLEVMGSLRMMMSDERVEREQKFSQMKDRFEEMGKQVQSNRHKIHDLTQMIRNTHEIQKRQNRS